MNNVSSILTNEIVQAYKYNRILWDINDPNYKNRVKRSNAIDDIARITKLSS